MWVLLVFAVIWVLAVGLCGSIVKDGSKRDRIKVKVKVLVLVVVLGWAAVGQAQDTERERLVTPDRLVMYGGLGFDLVASLKTVKQPGVTYNPQRTSATVSWLTSQESNPVLGQNSIRMVAVSSGLTIAADWLLWRYAPRSRVSKVVRYAVGAWHTEAGVRNIQLVK